MNHDKARSCRLMHALLLVASAMALTNAHCAAAAETVTAEISHFQFEPRELTVAPGTTVVWINHDQTIHNIVTKDGKLASPGLDTDDRFSFVFDREGDYPFYCGLHPQMVGVIHVRGSGS